MKTLLVSGIVSTLLLVVCLFACNSSREPVGDFEGRDTSLASSGFLIQNAAVPVCEQPVQGHCTCSAN